MATTIQKAKDLTKEAPRSPRLRLGSYVILGRTIDKGRAFLSHTNGEYHFDCPVDNLLFSFKVEATRPGRDPEQKEWFTSECRRLGLDPEKSTLFDYLETDDRKSFGKG